MAIQRIDVDTYLELSKKALESNVSVLQSVLADTIFLQSLYKKYHWHVEGEDFYQYHLLFDKHAGELIPLIDLIAERIRILGGVAPGMPDEVQHNKTVDEGKDPGTDARKMVANLLLVHDKCLKNVRSGAQIADKNNDMGTNDMLVSEVMRTHELQSWFIRSSASVHRR